MDDDIKERVRESVDIVELVSQHLTLRRSGALYVGHCPWHEDRRPSFQVNPVRQTFKCYPCDIGGDVFSFVMKMENCGFKEALEILADKAGITIPKFRKKRIVITQESGEEPVTALPGQPEPKEITKQTLFKAADWLAKIYHEALLTLDEAGPARQYLADRNIDTACIEKFQIGYSPAEKDFLVNKAKGTRERLKILELLGNLQHYEESDFWNDPFHGRIIFPIRNPQGQTIAFGGRVFGGSLLYNEKRYKENDNQPAKYYNSKENELFSKNQQLYALDIARQTMKHSNRALIVEGYTDVIGAHKFGFSDAVAALGVAVGENHIKLLKRFADKMILILDGDDAGQDRTDRILELFVAQGADMATLTLPDGQDPCEFLETYGAEAFQKLLETETVDVLRRAFVKATRGIDIKNDYNGAVRALESILTVIAKAPVQNTLPNDPIRTRIESLIVQLSYRFPIPLDEIRRRFEELRVKKGRQFAAELVSPAAEQALPLTDLPDALEREMLELFLLDPTAVYDFWETVPVERCRSSVTRQIYEKCNQLIERKKLATFARLMSAFEEPAMKQFLEELADLAVRKRNDILNNGLGSQQPVFHDEISDLEESLRQEREESQPLPKELKEHLVSEIIKGFDRRDEPQKIQNNINQLRNADLSEDEKLARLVEMQNSLRNNRR
ncbi:MAG: DNA primase [Planctomycetaceae bacterium]|jgi:DNA primase|nr:DNA primase [Planctomycetaceae bacterium]